MSNYQSVETVLETLTTEGYTDAVPVEAAEAVLGDVESNTAWYIKGLTGCGGWIAALFFFTFMGCWISLLVGNLFNNERAFGAVALAIGLLLLGGTVWLRNNINQETANQFALAVNTAAQILTVVGVYLAFTDTTDFEFSVTFVSVIVILLQLVLIPIYPDSSLRFLAVGAIAVSLNLIVYELQLPLGLTVLAGAFAIGTLVMWGGLLPAALEVKYLPILEPIRQALPLALFGTLIYELAETYYIETGVVAATYITTVILLALLLYVEIRILRDYNLPLTAPLSIGVIVVTVLVSLPALTTPGILAGVFVAVLGFRQRDGMVRAIAYVFLAGFVVHFYYDLQTTLLIKSFTLMGTGLLMLIGRVVLQRIAPKPAVAPA